jgi:signal transduction histidine kinase
MDKPRSFGLRGIRERMQSLNGSFHIASAEQGGTLLVLKVPLIRRDDRPTPIVEEALQQDLF